MLTEKQEKTLTGALGSGFYWPQMTDDPQVNCAIDVIICGTKPWERLAEEVKVHYIAEALAFSKFLNS